MDVADIVGVVAEKTVSDMSLEDVAPVFRVAFDIAVHPSPEVRR